MQTFTSRTLIALGNVVAMRIAMD